MDNHYQFNIGKASILLKPEDRFTVDWKLGVPVFESLDDLVARKPMTKDLKVGDTVFVPGLVGDVQKMTVDTLDWDGPNSVSAENDEMLALMEFNKDDRHCWICVSMVTQKI